MATPVKLTVGLRLGSALLDHIIMCIICVVFFIPMEVVDLVGAFSDKDTTGSPFGPSGILFYVGLAGFAVYFCKDCIGGQSIAKRMLKLRVVDNNTGDTASPMQCLVRNLSIVFWVIELIVLMFSPERRLGDLVAGTRLEPVPPDTEPKKYSLRKAMVPYFIILAALIMLVAWARSIISDVGDSEALRGTYNFEKSQQLQQLLTDSLQTYLNADVKVYDPAAGAGQSYIAIACQLKDNYLSDEEEAKELVEMVNKQVYSIYADSTVYGKVRYNYEATGIRKSRIVHIGKATGEQDE